MIRSGWCLGVLLAAGVCRAATLEVGPGKAHDRIEAAVAVASAGDTVLVYPAAGGAYDRVAVLVRTPGLIIRAAGPDRVKVSGRGFDYSGRGFVPRAIIQFERAGGGGSIEGFDLSGAHNGSHNGAGVRINQADNVTIRNCVIHGNDMGIMSNGDGTPGCATNQLVERCLVHGNGDRTEPGYNHNLYLGGGEVRLVGCEIRDSLTGHNVKSRAHRIEVRDCWIHDSANRELDLVDAAETGVPGSDAVLVGNYIAKGAKCPGNRQVIHCGQDGGKPRVGALLMVSNTVVTGFLSPAIALSSESVSVELQDNGFFAPGVRSGSLLDSGRLRPVVSGRGNRLPAAYAGAALDALGLAASTLEVGTDVPPPPARGFP